MRRPQVQKSWFDSAAMAISPAWGVKRIQNKMKLAAYTEAGFMTPGSRRKSMKGIDVGANSPDDDINEKLEGIRALSRDMAMNSPLATSILKRHRTDIVNFGLQVQAAIDEEAAGITAEQARAVEQVAEREFDTWAESLFSDWDEDSFFGELQGLALFTTLLSGDCWILNTADPAVDKNFPYSSRVKLIDADLVRDPVNGQGDVAIDITRLDIEGGVEKNAKGRVVAIYVWDTYPNESWNPSTRKLSRWKRVPIYTEGGRRQVHPLFERERIGQRRGVALLAPAFEPLKQLTRLSEAQLMNALVAAFFSVFVKDISGMGTTMGAAMTPEETLFGGGTYGPDKAPESEVNQADGNDLEMASGNINYLDADTDIEIADPKKVDTGFEAFWNTLANQVTAAGGMPLEKAMLKYTTSYTAARAALIDAFKFTKNWRKILERRLCKPAYEAFFEEAVLRGRINAPGFFDDYTKRQAYLGTRWVGIGMGSLDPLKEAKAALFNLRTYITTHEDEYQQVNGGRWEGAMKRRASEEKLISEQMPASTVAVDETVSTQDAQDSDNG